MCIFTQKMWVKWGPLGKFIFYTLKYTIIVQYNKILN